MRVRTGRFTNREHTPHLGVSDIVSGPCAGWSHDIGSKSVGREASTANLYSSEIAQEVVDHALQIFGGLGAMQGTAVERLYRHFSAFRTFDGTSEIRKLIIAKYLLTG